MAEQLVFPERLEVEDWDKVLTLYNEGNKAMTKFTLQENFVIFCFALVESNGFNVTMHKEIELIESLVPAVENPPVFEDGEIQKTVDDLMEKGVIAAVAPPEKLS